MGQRGQPVVKYHAGEEVRRYESAQEAAHDNGISAYKLYNRMKRGMEIDGFTYMFGYMIRKHDPKPKPESDHEPWERDGMFDIKGWAKVCF